MNIYQIEAFITLAEVLNYTKAAQILHTTQPNLSKMIVNIEQELGVRLLMRNKRDVRLTPAGAAFYEDSCQTMEQYRTSIDRAKKIDLGIEGVIDIGFLGTALSDYLPKIVNRFRQKYPKIKLNLMDYTFSPLIGSLTDEKIDAAFTLDRELDNIKNLEKKFIFSDDMCLVAHKDHPLAQLECVSMSQLKGEDFIMLDPDISIMDYRLVSDMCQEHGFPPHVVAEANTLQNVLVMVECKVGIAILSQHMQRFASDYVRFIPIQEFKNYFKVICAWRRGENPSMPALLSVIDGISADN